MTGCWKGEDKKVTLHKHCALDGKLVFKDVWVSDILGYTRIAHINKYSPDN